MSQKISTTYLISILLRLLWSVVALILVLCLAFPIGFYGMAMYIEPSLPKISEIKTMPLEMPLQIYTADNKLIGQYGNTYSLPIAYEELPQTFMQAFLAAEDDSFFEHSGISVKGLGRAITQMVTNNDQQTGGSTITQQVAKNYFLSSEQTFERKLTEMFLARRIERELDKDEILTLYVNKIYLGQGAYGVRAGARRYYNKELNELTIAEMAMLAGLPKAPSEFNPVANPARAVERRNWILGRMLSHGFIDQAEYNEAVASDINLNMHKEKLDVNMPDLAEIARKSLVENYGDKVMNSGWRVKLTIDSQNQFIAEEALIQGLKQFSSQSYCLESRSGDASPNAHDDGTYSAKVINAKTGLAVLGTGEEIKAIGSCGIKVRTGNIIRVKKSGKSWEKAKVFTIQGAIASINPENGAIVAVAGGNGKTGLFNRAVHGYRQPGSTIKPLIYAAGFENKKFNANDSLPNTVPKGLGNWKPKGAGGGSVSIHAAIARSYNMPVIHAYLKTGKEAVHAMLSNFGLNRSRIPEGAAITLGALDATPLQMATAYATFVNGGHRVQPYMIEQIYSFDNDLVYQANPQQSCALCFNSELEATNKRLQKEFDNSQKPTKKDEKKSEDKQSDDKDAKQDTKAQTENKDSKQNTDKQTDTPSGEPIKEGKQANYNFWRLSPRIPTQYTVATQAPRIMTAKNAYDMANMLRSVIASGTGTAAKLQRPDIGGKTGTTNNAKDVWFVGVHPTNVAAVWAGFDQPKSLGGVTGGKVAAPIWRNFMRTQLQDVPIQWVSAENQSKAKSQKQQVVDITDDMSPEELEKLLNDDTESGGEIPEGDGEAVTDDNQE